MLFETVQPGDVLGQVTPEAAAHTEIRRACTSSPPPTTRQSRHSAVV
jgi:hypothetical protein